LPGRLIWLRWPSDSIGDALREQRTQWGPDLDDPYRWLDLLADPRNTIARSTRRRRWSPAPVARWSLATCSP
jgi:hypothetical protein